MRDAVATRHIRRSEFGWQLTSDQCLVGRIESDAESDGRLPLVVIDGQAAAASIACWSAGPHQVIDDCNADQVGQLV